MYGKRRHQSEYHFITLDDLDPYEEHLLDKQVEDGTLSAAEAGFLREFNNADEY
jgi:hypothetical protein